MAKEFDIYLRRHLTECDIIVYSLPIRQSFTADDALIINSYIDGYTLQKHITANVGIDLIDRVEEMLKTSYEAIDIGMDVDANIEEFKKYVIEKASGSIAVTTNDLDVIEWSFIDAENGLEIYIPAISTDVAKSTGIIPVAIKFDQSVVHTLKTGFLKIMPAVEILSAVADTNKQAFESADDDITLCANVESLAQRLHFSLDNSIAIGADDIDLTPSLSLGKYPSNIEIVFGARETKRCLMDTPVNTQIDINVDDVVCEQMAYPNKAALSIRAEATAVIRRSRRLYEMDDDAISEYDDMKLDDVDFITL